MTKYKKLRNGDWGIVGPAEEVKGAVTVTKASGERKVEQVGKVIWKGDGVSIATIERNGRRNGQGRYCEECGEAIRSANQRCWETGLLCG